MQSCAQQATLCWPDAAGNTSAAITSRHPLLRPPHFLRARPPSRRPPTRPRPTRCPMRCTTSPSAPASRCGTTRGKRWTDMGAAAASGVGRVFSMLPECCCRSRLPLIAGKTAQAQQRPCLSHFPSQLSRSASLQRLTPLDAPARSTQGRSNLWLLHMVRPCFGFSLPPAHHSTGISSSDSGAKSRLAACAHQHMASIILTLVDE
jgi:hypothetical protein